MRLGIIGLPQSGKTTLFNALTRGDRPTTTAGGRVEVHTAVVDVPDARLDRLAELYNPKKITYAKITYLDIAGLDGSAAEEGISGELLNHLSQVDGFLLAARGFEDENVPHPSESVDPGRDAAALEAELLLNDLIAVESKQERLLDERRKGGGRDKTLIEREMALFERLHAALSEEKALREMPFTPEESKTLSSFGFLSLKPVLVVLNLGEGQTPPEIEHPNQVSIQGKLEMEIAQLPPEEAAVFLAEYGIQEPSLDRMIRLSYDLLGLLSFFTVDQDKEVRAWTLRRGGLAPEAAGTVHSDMERGFIRAEVTAFDDLSALGSEAEARAQGKLRVEGKNYVVQDGDVMRIRFNV